MSEIIGRIEITTRLFYDFLLILCRHLAIVHYLAMPHTHPERTGQAACRPLDHLAAVGDPC